MAAAAAPSYCTDLIIYPTAGGVTEMDNLSLSNSDTKTFVGLSNQGCTCYMNSLLQTLYMTAEFRHALYKWKYSPDKDGDEEYCIPLQLQKLFGFLQLSPTRAVDTVALTKSFGWEGNERFQQQDVQELCRVLFDALEESFKGHPEVENFIDELYAGILIDYIKCMDVDYQSERKDKFLDYSIAIRPFGAEESMKSVTECIEHYLEPEILDGDNQYLCDSVGRKVDAIKGLKFGCLPQVMSVQMKRFVFDFSGETIVQKKINDKVTFPLILDMNKYVSRGTKSTSSAKTSSGDEESVELNGVDEFDQFLQRRIKELRAGSKEPLPDEKDEKEEKEKSGNEDNNDDTLPSLVDCNGTVLNAAKEEEKEEKESSDTLVEEYFDHDIDPLKLIEEKGEWVYQLYAVLVHSGAISGGHYYVYIRDTSTNKWWNFNDSSVTEVTEKTVLEAQGGFTTASTYTPPSSTYMRYPAPVTRQIESCANAYMLMYRKVTAAGAAAMVVEFPDDALVPEYIREELQRATDEAAKRKKETQERMNKISVAVHWRKKKYDIATKKNATYNDFLQQVWSELPIYDDEKEMFEYISDKEAVPLEGIRLRVFNTYHKVPGLPFDVQKSGEKTLDFLRISFHRELFIEAKGREDTWESYETDGITILMCEFDTTTNAFKVEHEILRLPKKATLGDLRNKMIPFTTLDVNCIRIMKLAVWAQSEVKAVELVDNALQLNSQLQVFEGQKLYWEENTTPIETSLGVEAFKTTANQMSLNVKDGREKGNKLTKLSVDKRWDLGRLRSHVKEVMELEEDFRICKFAAPQAEVTGDEHKALSGLGFYTGMTVIIKLGAPMLPGHFNFKVFLYRADYRARVNQLGDSLPDRVLNTEIDPEVVAAVTIQDTVVEGDVDKISTHSESAADVVTVTPVPKKSTFGTDKVSLLPGTQQFEFLLDVPVHGDLLVEDLRAVLFKQLKSRHLMSESDSVKQVRVRLKGGQTCTDILRDSLTLRQSKVAMYADRALAVQILDHEEDIEPLQPGDALVFVRRWHRSSWSLSPLAEMHLKGNMPVKEIATALAIQYRVPPASMRVLVTHPYTIINMCDLNRLSPSLTSDWIDPIPETKTLSEVQWHLSYGDCIIIQDEAEPLRALTSEEEQSVKDSQLQNSTSYSTDYITDTWWDDAVPAPAPSSSSSSSSATVVSGPQPRVMQRGIVIKTQKAREIEKEKMKTNEGEASANLLLCIDEDDEAKNTNVGGCSVLFGDVD